MPAEFDIYLRGDGWAHRLDPRVKLGVVVLVAVLVFLWADPWISAVVAALCFILLGSAGMPIGRAGRALLGLAPLLAIVLVLTILFGDAPGAVLLRAGPLQITTGDLFQAALFAFRLLALALVLLFWLATTDQAAMVRGFVALRMPYEWGLVLALAMRYLPVLAGRLAQVREAQQARGLDLAGGGVRQRLRAYQPILVALVISVVRSSEHLGWALETRGLGAGGVSRTCYRPLRLRTADLVVAAFLAVLLAAAILVRVL